MEQAHQSLLSIVMQASIARGDGYPKHPMHPVVESKRAELAAACQRFGVRRLEVFGSAARGDFDEAHSDIEDALEALFERPVDLVSVGAVQNPYVAGSIDRDRTCVYTCGND